MAENNNEVILSEEALKKLIQNIQSNNTYSPVTNNYVFAGPNENNTSAVPSFRKLTADDIPELPKTKLPTLTVDDIPDLTEDKIPSNYYKYHEKLETNINSPNVAPGIYYIKGTTHINRVDPNDDSDYSQFLPEDYQHLTNTSVLPSNYEHFGTFIQLGSGNTATTSGALEIPKTQLYIGRYVFCFRMLTGSVESGYNWSPWQKVQNIPPATAVSSTATDGYGLTRYYNPYIETNSWKIPKGFEGAGFALTVSQAENTYQRRHQATTINGISFTNATTVNITTTGVTTNNTILVSPTPGTWSLWRDHGIRCTAQATDQITLTADEKFSGSVGANIVILD